MKYKKPKNLLKLIWVLIFIGIASSVAYAISRVNNSEMRTKAAPVCELAINIKRTPTPSKPPSTPTPTKPSSVCKVTFEHEDTAVCWFKPIKNLPVKYTVHSLPTGNGPYYMQTDWYLAAPRGNEEPAHHYVENQQIEAGKTYTVNVDWPGIDSYNPRPSVVEIHVGLNVVDKDHNLIEPVNCTDGLDYYWTPYVICE